jgi:GxxExxY protein
MLDYNELTGKIIGCAMKVHSILGPGLLESAYRACLVHELNRSGLETKIELPCPINYDGLRLDVGYRLDVLVQETVVVESRPSRSSLRSTKHN